MVLGFLKKKKMGGGDGDEEGESFLSLAISVWKWWCEVWRRQGLWWLGWVGVDF